MSVRLSPADMSAQLRAARVPTPARTSLDADRALVFVYTTSVADGWAWVRHLGCQAEVIIGDGYVTLLADPVTWHGWTVIVQSLAIESEAPGVRDG